MQQQSRLPLRRMKAQIFSCVIWKVASSIILWAHAGTDEEEEDEHYVFTTALNTAPPGVLFLFHHTHRFSGVCNEPTVEAESEGSQKCYTVVTWAIFTFYYSACWDIMN